MYKFEKLEVWQLSLEYLDRCYEISGALPALEDFNLKSQLRRAATSIALNIAEGSTGQTDAEQVRFLGLAIRSLLETVACLRIVVRRRYQATTELVEKANEQNQHLHRKLQAMRKSLAPNQPWLREGRSAYGADAEGGDTQGNSGTEGQ
ncbi:MAG TPA: four helix bundle protein [Anaerolineales bacterium]|nr:four helix bundle protein [Anaerolineales bacterium]